MNECINEKTKYRCFYIGKLVKWHSSDCATASEVAVPLLATFWRLAPKSESIPMDSNFKMLDFTTEINCINLEACPL